MSADPNDIRKHTDWMKVVLFVVAIVGFFAGFGDRIMSLGKTSATVDVSAVKVDRLEATQNQMSVDMARTKMQAEMANGAAQRIEVKVDHINDVLMQLNITGHRR